jgi:hypothetical protein
LLQVQRRQLRVQLCDEVSSRLFSVSVRVFFSYEGYLVLLPLFHVM